MINREITLWDTLIGPILNLSLSPPAWHLRLRNYYSAEDLQNEYKQMDLTEPPQYKEKQTILPQPIHLDKGITSTPLKRTAEGKLKVPTSAHKSTPGKTDTNAAVKGEVEGTKKCEKIDMRNLSSPSPLSSAKKQPDEPKPTTSQSAIKVESSTSSAAEPQSKSSRSRDSSSSSTTRKEDKTGSSSGKSKQSHHSGSSRQHSESRHNKESSRSSSGNSGSKHRDRSESSSSKDRHNSHSSHHRRDGEKSSHRSHSEKERDREREKRHKSSHHSRDGKGSSSSSREHKSSGSSKSHSSSVDKEAKKEKQSEIQLPPVDVVKEEVIIKEEVSPNSPLVVPVDSVKREILTEVNPAAPPTGSINNQNTSVQQVESGETNFESNPPMSLQPPPPPQPEAYDALPPPPLPPLPPSEPSLPPLPPPAVVAPTNSPSAKSSQSVDLLSTILSSMDNQ